MTTPEFLPHPFAEIFPLMTGTDLLELTRSMETRGFHKSEPVVLYQGKILDGRNRYAVAQRLKITPCFSFFNGNDADALAFVLSHNLARRHLTTSQRAIVAATLVTARHGGARFQAAKMPLEFPLVSQYHAAAKLGVSVRSVRAAVKLRDTNPALAAKVAAGQATIGAATSSGKKNGKPHVTHNSGDEEWYTPDAILEVVRAVLGTIDLDPASCQEAQERVKAERYFAQKCNALDRVWTGKVFLNPPYHACEAYLHELVRFHLRGDVPEAIALVNNATETGWAQRALDRASAVCMIRGRVQFHRPRASLDPVGSPLQGQILLYFGDRPCTFVEHARALGFASTIASGKPDRNAKHPIGTRSRHMWDCPAPALPPALQKGLCPTPNCAGLGAIESGDR
jgi:phage N-6-adenine-methyltransferase